MLGFIQAGAAILGAAQSAQAAGDAKRALQEATSLMLGIPIPELEKYTPEQLINMGNFSPEELQAIGILGPSAVENIQLDPRLRADQETALGQARERALRGLTAEDSAILDQYMRQASNTAQSGTQAALQDMARRGMSGSGNALAAALQSSQGAANMQSQQAMQAAAMRLQSQDRNTDALSRMAAGLESTDYNRSMDLANKRDSIAEFNQRLRQDVANTNVGNRNLAQQSNLTNSQRISDANIKERNRAQEVENQRKKDQFDMMYKRNAGAAGLMGDQAKAYQTAAKNMADSTGKMIAGAGGLKFKEDEDEE